MNADDIVQLVVAGDAQRVLGAAHARHVDLKATGVCLGSETIGRQRGAASGLIGVASTPAWCTADSIR
jgi:hypothetical protein